MMASPDARRSSQQADRVPRTLALLLLSALALATPSRAQDRPNVVLMFPDNLGLGEVG